MSTDALPDDGSARAAYQRYTAVAILLHWVIAALILWQIGFGIWLEDALKSEDEAVKFFAFEQTQLHKSIGLTVLALSVLRLIWRLANATPGLPAGMKPHERVAAHASHFLFYALMLGMPLTGWLMVSTSVELGSIPTVYFGLFEIPHLPVVSELAVEAKGEVAGISREVHGALGWTALALVILHVGAALKHHIVDRDAVLARMAPGVSPRSAVVEPELARAGAGRRLAAVGVAAAAAAFAVFVWSGERDAAMEASSEVAAAEEPELAAPGSATLWAPSAPESAIVFSGTHSGTPFEGRFESWKAKIAFDPEHLDASEVVVIVEMASAKTGDSIYDGALGEKDWLDPAAHPKGTYVATDFAPGDAPGSYVAKGSLTLKGVEKPADLPFTLILDGDRAEMTAEVVLDRSEFGIGVVPDASGAWVSLEIPLSIKVVAERADPDA